MGLCCNALGYQKTTYSLFIFDILVLESDYSASLTLLMHYPKLTDIGMTMQDLLESAKRLKTVYESKTYAISTTPRILDNLDKINQTYSSKPLSSNGTPQGYRAKLDALNELEQELHTLKQNNAAMDRRFSRLKIRDGKMIAAITATITDLESLRDQPDKYEIIKVINSQCDSLRSLVESLKHSSIEFDESAQTHMEHQHHKSENLDFIQSGLDKAASAFRTSVDGLNKVIFRGSEAAIKQGSVIKMHPKISANDSSHIITDHVGDKPLFSDQ